MSKFPVLASLLFTFAMISAAGPATHLTGVITSIDSNGIVKFRTASEDVEFYLDGLSKEQQALARGSGAKNHIFSVDPDPEKIISHKAVGGSIRPDCSELPVSVGDLDTLATSGNVNSMEDF
jgi:hypothetical protein